MCCGRAASARARAGPGAKGHPGPGQVVLGMLAPVLSGPVRRKDMLTALQEAIAARKGVATINLQRTLTLLRRSFPLIRDRQRSLTLKVNPMTKVASKHDRAAQREQHEAAAIAFLARLSPPEIGVRHG